MIKYASAVGRIIYDAFLDMVIKKKSIAVPVASNLVLDFLGCGRVLSLASLEVSFVEHCCREKRMPVGVFLAIGLELIWL
jgi:hypothetical protein